MTYRSVFTILHGVDLKTGLVDDNVALLTAGPQILTVTQQTPTCPQGEAETKMSK